MRTRTRGIPLYTDGTREGKKPSAGMPQRCATATIARLLDAANETSGMRARTMALRIVTS
jgi:hypothetical protein